MNDQYTMSLEHDNSSFPSLHHNYLLINIAWAIQSNEEIQILSGHNSVNYFIYFMFPLKLFCINIDRVCGDPAKGGIQ